MNKYIKFIKNDWKIFCLVAIIFMIAILVVAVLLVKKNNASTREQGKGENQTPACENCVRRAIDGIYAPSGSENPPVYAVMIDNHIDARPSAGLSKASLVYEAEAEGITRYMAIFTADKEIKKIGPVRSARPYFLEWSKEFSALYTHCGGSPSALAKIIKDRVPDLNEFYNEKYFWRDKSISAPHNVFTSSEKITEYISEEDLKSGSFFSWKYKDDNKPETASSSEITIDFYGKNFLVEWKYDADKNGYVRYLAGEKVIDGGDEVIAKNIILQYTNSKVLDDELRLEMKTLGSGKAIICMDGACREGEWRKSASSERTRYYFESEEISFNAGSAWIEVLNRDQEVKY